MSIWDQPALTSLYTLSPTHVGTGQAGGAVDLPIARESHTGLPILPATALKGVARHACHDAGLSDVTTLFGPDVRTDGDEPEERRAGELVFSEGHLLAYPFRSLNRPFLLGTCPGVVSRLVRGLRAVGLTKEAAWWEAPSLSPTLVDVADAKLVDHTLVLEGLSYDPSDLRSSPAARTLAELMGELLSPDDKVAKERLKTHLVVMPDIEFHDVASQAPPVRARIQLTHGKTTSRWRAEDGTEEEGNLWYEEVIPPDCLFTCLVGRRRRRSSGETENVPTRPWSDIFDHLKVVQIGGLETVGAGLCAWHFQRSDS